MPTAIIIPFPPHKRVPPPQTASAAFRRRLRTIGAPAASVVRLPARKA